MSEIREYTPADYATLKAWWEARKAPVIPETHIPTGWIISAGGVKVAMAFLLMDFGGKFAVAEFLTTNPSVAYSRTLISDVKELFAHIEGVAQARGCLAVWTFSGIDSGEERLMKKIGYEPADGIPHRILVKTLKQGGI